MYLYGILSICSSLNCLLTHTKDSDGTNSEKEREKTTEFESRERIE